MNFEELTEDQKARARACKSPEELLELAKSEGVELSEEELDAVSGGDSWLDCSDLCSDLGTCALLRQCEALHCHLY